MLRARSALLALACFVAAGAAAIVPACSSPVSRFDDSDAASGSDGGPPEDGSIFTVPDASGDTTKPPAPVCDISCTSAGGQCVSGVCTIVDNPGNKVDPATQQKLAGGGSADAQFSFMYPYDKTVFPRGLSSPTLQFAGSGASAVYVHMTSATLDFKGYYQPATGPLRIALSATQWSAVTNAVGAKDSLKVEVTKLLGASAVTGPATETWTIAQGSLRGTIYYETYDSQIAGGLGSVGIMKLKPGQGQPVVIKSGCGNVCHTASADGSTMVASTAFPGGSASYDLKSNASTLKAQPDNSFTYGGIFPNGSISMSSTNYRTWLGTPSRLYDVKTGAQIAASGWDNVINKAGTPAFSPDGKKLAFIHEDKDNGHTLSVMDFDLTKKAFSNLVDLATDGASYMAWPAFTPDSASIVYHAGSSAAFETDNGATGDLYWVDVATKKAHRLDAADGYASGNASYLPAQDPALSFAPTVLPEAVGGYYWVVFTSHRSYGNTLPSLDNKGEYGKLWVAAFDLHPAPGTDPSHPAFFLDGQELAADNLRGFWVLDPCKGDGQSCTSGDQCCNGFCRASADGGALVCVPPPGGCSNEFEKCNTAADCCNPTEQCINNHCAFVPN